MNNRTGKLLLLLAVIFYSCEKIITVDLNDADPQMVIEGAVSDQSGPYSVVLSKTGSYFEPTLVVPPVTKALVTIADDQGNKDTLKEAQNGIYNSTKLKGVPGRTYTLTVTAEGKQYSAISSMPGKVKIDSMFYAPAKSFGEEKGFDIYVMFKDPPEPGNYYRIRAYLNSHPPFSTYEVQGSYLLYQDKLVNGNEITERLRVRRGVAIGDTITVELYSIDRATYDFYSTLRDVISSDRSASALAPANPNTNLSNGSLGFFAAYTIDTRSLILR